MKPKGIVYKGRMERYPDEVWLIWSNKWGCWYRDNSQGYTCDLARAGLFDRATAASHMTPLDKPRSYRDTEPFPLSVVASKIAARPTTEPADDEVEVVALAMENAVIRDDEGQFPPLRDLIDFSGDNKYRTVVRALARAALTAMSSRPSVEEDMPEGWRIYTVDASIEGRWAVMLKGPEMDYPAEEDLPAHKGPSYVSEVGNDLQSAVAACARAIRERGVGGGQHG